MDEAPAHGPAGAREAHRRAVVIVGAMAVSLFVYAVVVELINRSDVVRPAHAPTEAMRWAFYAVAVSMVFASHLVKGFMLRGSRPRSAEEALSLLTTAHIITAALSEVPAVLGLVLFFLGRRFYADFYILSLISLYLMIRHFPRYARWEELLRRHAPGT